MRIIQIDALQILDSRGNPTLQVSVILEDGSFGVFEVPSGASTGIHEAHELRDKDESYYFGKSVSKAISNIEEIRDSLYDKDFTQKTLDDKLIEIDGTPNKEKLGANSILGISIAFAKASAKYYNIPLFDYLNRLFNGKSFQGNSIAAVDNVHPFANLINGGLHSGNDLMVQEFMVVPVFGSIHDKIRSIAEIYQCLKLIISSKYGKSNTGVGDEGGFAPNISSVEDALDILVKAIERANYTGKVKIAMDAAASDFYIKETNKYEVEKGKYLDFKELSDFYNKLIERYPIISIEDPFVEDDFKAFNYFIKHSRKLTEVNPLTKDKSILIVGDDLLVTNTSRIEEAVSKKLCNSLLLKINQIGTLSESLEAFKLANNNNWHTIVSHRSGETIDSFISDLAVALGSSIKLGAPARGERVAKYNRLIEIYN